MTVSRIFFAVTAGLLFAAATLQAAEFQEVNSTTSNPATPGTPPPCSTAAAAASAASAPGPNASASSAAAASGNGQDGACSNEGSASAGARLVADVAPTGGDQLGDPVTACAVMNAAVAEGVTGQGRAVAAAGGLNPETPALIFVNNVPLVASIPIHQIVSGEGQDNDSVACQRQLDLKVGDRLVLEVGVSTQVQLQGVGQPASAAAAATSLEIGACPVEAETPRCPDPSSHAIPTLSRWALSVLALALALTGLLMARRVKREV